MSDKKEVRVISPEIFEYLSKPESQRIAWPSEHFQSKAKKETPMETKAATYQIRYVVYGKDLADWDGECPNKLVLVPASTDEEATNKFEMFKAGLKAKGTCYHSLCLEKTVKIAS